METYKLRSWVKVVLILIAGAIIGITIYQLFTVKTTDRLTGATCNGGIIKICAGTPSQYKIAMSN